VRNHPRSTDSADRQAAGHHQGHHRQRARPQPTGTRPDQAGGPGDAGPGGQLDWTRWCAGGGQEGQATPDAS
jgi:hypothetical protein